ncbi:MAG: hypothetical protein C0518_05440 [Opitutus sp.]|nr:hypothetical protein [Opitutus sp.]
MPHKPANPPVVINGILSRPASREYTVLMMRHGHRFEFYPPKPWRSNLRIRAFAHTMFVKWFGRSPDRRRLNWHDDGFMAECCDRRGNCVQVEQFNHGDPRHSNGTWNKVEPIKPAAPLLLTWPADERRAS